MADSSITQAPASQIARSWRKTSGSASGGGASSSGSSSASEEMSCWRTSAAARVKSAMSARLPRIAASAASSSSVL